VLPVTPQRRTKEQNDVATVGIYDYADPIREKVEEAKKRLDPDEFLELLEELRSMLDDAEAEAA
jgi:GH18 family chitinase